MNLLIRKMSDDDLRMNASKAAHRYRGCDAEVILYVQEVDRRHRYKDWGFKGLVEWIEKELELSDGSAHLRINAAKMLNEFPQLAEKIDQGAYNISTLSLVQTYFNENKIKDSLLKAQVLTEIEWLSKKKTIKRLFELSGKRKKVFEGMERVSADSCKVTWELQDRTIDLLKKIMAMVHKKLSYDEIIFLALTALMEKMTKQIFKTTTERKSSGANPTKRRFSNHAVRTAYQRSGGYCEICGSPDKLQKDHIKPFSLGGLSTADNCRILCRTCNLNEAMKKGLFHPGEMRSFSSTKNPYISGGD